MTSARAMLSRRLVIAALILLPNCAGPSALRDDQGGRPPASAQQVEDRALALAVPCGSEARHALLRRLATEVRAAPDAQRWIALGRAWIREARASGDGGYWLAVAACSRLARTADPTSIDADRLDAMTLLQEHRFADARRAATALLERSADDAEALGMLEIGRAHV